MSRTFITSDPHFGHANVIPYENRPFDDVPHMDYQLIKRWNQTIGKNDKVYVLGDISFTDKERTKELISQLVGYKILILGNHDRSRSVTWFKDVGFAEVHKFPICVDWRFWLSHEPMPMSADLPFINLHGHTHQRELNDGLHVNVCVEHTDYRPILLESITSRFPKPELEYHKEPYQGERESSNG